MLKGWGYINVHLLNCRTRIGYKK